MKIKGIILDVDGVIVGEKIGFNSPDPHPDVMKKLKEVRKKGIQISLCTAKPHFSIGNIIKGAGLDNYHIADGGGVIINPIDNKVVEKNTIESEVAAEVIDEYIKQGAYIEYYTVDEYVIQKSQASKITKQHEHILQQKPRIVEDLAKAVLTDEATKLMPIAKDEKDKERFISIFEPFKERLTLSWGVHPVALPLQFGIVTAPGISKKQGAISISKNFKVDFKQMLGVGDSASDWQFIGMCKYGAAMGNASQDLKDLVLARGKEFGYVGKSVDENGIIEILDYFIKD